MGRWVGGWVDEWARGWMYNMIAYVCVPACVRVYVSRWVSGCKIGQTDRLVLGCVGRIGMVIRTNRGEMSKAVYKYLHI